MPRRYALQQNSAATSFDDGGEPPQKTELADCRPPHQRRPPRRRLAPVTCACIDKLNTHCVTHTYTSTSTGKCGASGDVRTPQLKTRGGIMPWPPAAFWRRTLGRASVVSIMTPREDSTRSFGKSGELASSRNFFCVATTTQKSKLLRNFLCSDHYTKIETAAELFCVATTTQKSKLLRTHHPPYTLSLVYCVV